MIPAMRPFIDSSMGETYARQTHPQAAGSFARAKLSQLKPEEKGALVKENKPL
jgi:hypothetical protein